MISFNVKFHLSVYNNEYAYSSTIHVFSSRLWFPFNVIHVCVYSKEYTYSTAEFILNVFYFILTK
jgi:hypothetical protein